MKCSVFCGARNSIKMKRALASKMLLLYLPSQEKIVKGRQTEKEKKRSYIDKHSHTPCNLEEKKKRRERKPENLV